ncbi:hypothetical protein HY630_03310 [Candidatus Uhrbacteria bacterium]|nr:hypothetical protein [Candidatus Uhrbacteria bacterium]
MDERLYIVNDIETAGHRVGGHAVLSWGACVVTREALTPAERRERGLTFYVELKPISREIELEAIRVGCVGLHCLRLYKGDPRYDPSSTSFDPRLVFDALERDGLWISEAVERFLSWLERVREGKKVVGVFDTVLFDPAFIQLLFMHGSIASPYGHHGMDLDALHKGFARNMGAKLRDLGVPDTRETAHCADDDAMYLADIARVLIYERIGA